MKTFFSNFVIMFAISIAALSCSEDIWVHDGADGKDGEDGFTSLMHFDEVTQTKIFYLDRDRNLSLTSQDSILYQESKEGFLFIPVGDCIELYKTVGTTEIFVGSICDGVDGETGPQGPAGNDGEAGSDGQDGEAGIVVFSIVPDSVNCKSGMRVIMTSLQGGEEISSVSFCVPRDGEDGMTVVQRDTIVIIDSIFIFNTDSIVRIDSIFVIGEDTTIKTCEFLSLPDFQDKFNNPDNSWHYWNEGYLFEKGLISINGVDSPEGNGTVVLHKYGANWAEFWTPEFPESAITGVELDVGSRSTWKIECLFLTEDNQAFVVHSQVIEGKPDMVWFDNNSYGNPFTYYIPWSNIRFKDVVRVGFRIHKYRDWKSLNRNHSFNGDNLRISRVKVLK